MRTIVLLLVFVLAVTFVNISSYSVFAQNMSKKESFPNAHKAKGEKPTTLGTSACIIDAKTGYMIFGVDEHEKAYPASTTKIMTGLLAMENLKPDDIVTVDGEAEEQGGSQLYLANGQRITVKDLMYGMMLPSANDAALALGKAMGGTTEEFAGMMNEKAKSIGAVDSNFVNPNGLPDKNHYTTAYDLALIAKEAMKYDDFRKIVATYQYTIPKTNLSGSMLIHNRNRLLYNINRKVEAYGETKSIKYPGVTGIKTGYTDKSKFCLVGSAERNGTEFIAVTMKTQDMNGYQDVVSMLDYGFNNYKTVEVMKEGASIDDLKVDGGTEKYAKAVAKDGLYATLPIDGDQEDIKIETEYQSLNAPYDAGIDGGIIKVYYDGEKVGETKVSITQAMEEGSAIDDLFTGSGLLGLLAKIFIVIAILIVLILVIRSINRNRQRKARRRRRRREYK